LRDFKAELVPWGREELTDLYGTNTPDLRWKHSPHTFYRFTFKLKVSVNHLPKTS